MRNPSYLVKSRHAIYYFRYPLPKAIQKPRATNRISISLNTRCPKQALQLSKILEYHALIIMQNKAIYHMDYVEVVSLLKGHFAELLDDAKSKINKNGPLTEQRIASLNSHLETIKEAIENDSAEIFEYTATEGKIPERLSLDHYLNPITEKNGIDFDKSSAEYGMLRQEYKYALQGFIKSLLDYNSQIRDYSLTNMQASSVQVSRHRNKAEYTLPKVIGKYLDEVRGTMAERSHEGLKSCLIYLPELLGDNFDIREMDGETARHVKECLTKTPTHRNKKTATRNLSLKEQIQVEGVEKFSNRTVNKYLTYFSGFFKWAQNNNYVAGNHFAGMELRDKKAGKREAFNKAEISLILNELDKKESGLANNDMKYWSTLLFSTQEPDEMK